MYRNIYSLNTGLSKSLKGKTAQISLNKELFKTNYDLAITDIGRKYDQFLKLNKLTNSPLFLYPKQATRLMERQKPHEERNLIRKEAFRKRDRAVIKSYCDFFMFSQRRYKPHKE